MSTSSSTQAVSSDVAGTQRTCSALIQDRKNQTPASAPVKAVEQSCVTCGGGHSYQNCPATNSNIYHDNIQEYVSQAAAANFNQANSGYRPPMVSNQIRPPGFLQFRILIANRPKAVNHDTEVTKDTMPPANNGSTEDVQPPVVQIQTRNPNPEPNVAPVVTPVPKASIPFPSRRNDERRKEKANDQIEKFYEIFRDLSFEISYYDGLDALA
ncbi:hypothetical protein Tco_0546209 [Tanacetum coccineum]